MSWRRWAVRILSPLRRRARQLLDLPRLFQPSRLLRHPQAARHLQVRSCPSGVSVAGTGTRGRRSASRPTGVSLKVTGGLRAWCRVVKESLSDVCLVTFAWIYFGLFSCSYFVPFSCTYLASLSSTYLATLVYTYLSRFSTSVLKNSTFFSGGLELCHSYQIYVSFVYLDLPPR